MLRLSATCESFPLRHPFRISRGSKTHADVVLVRLEDASRCAFAESVPYARYRESLDSVLHAIGALGERHATLEALQEKAKSLSGAAANAVCTAMFAFANPEACQSALTGFSLADTSRTLTIDAPQAMAQMALGHPARILKMKLAGDGLDLGRMRAVHAAVPSVPLWLDANEGLDAQQCYEMLPALSELGVVLVEQPFPADARENLPHVAIPFCADEAFHGAHDLDRVVQLGYRAVNIKLDKAGGLLAAESAAVEAHARGLIVVLGCMVSTSLSIAAANLLRKRLLAKGIPLPFVDLDGAEFLASDRALGGTGWG